MAESVDARDSKSRGLWPYEFESRPGYCRGTHNFTPIFGVYIYGGEATDRVASIETQSFGEGGRWRRR